MRPTNGALVSNTGGASSEVVGEQHDVDVVVHTLQQQLALVTYDLKQQQSHSLQAGAAHFTEARISMSVLRLADLSISGELLLHTFNFDGVSRREGRC